MRSERAKPGGGGVFSDVSLARVYEVLNRGARIASLTALEDALEQTTAVKANGGKLGVDQLMGGISSTRFALAFDSNVLFRLDQGDTAGASAHDYLRAHKGPIIFPGQVVQEIWNNALGGVKGPGKDLKTRFEALVKATTVADVRPGSSFERVLQAIEELNEEHSHWIDPGSFESLQTTISIMKDRALCVYVPRSEFAELGRIRNDTKTPPGFKDDDNNHGDYFVWADFLYGLAQVDMSEVEAVMFVTNEEKKDWTRAGVCHPVLRAEVERLTAKPFYLCDLEAFRKFISQFME